MTIGVKVSPRKNQGNESGYGGSPGFPSAGLGGAPQVVQAGKVGGVSCPTKDMPMMPLGQQTG